MSELILVIKLSQAIGRLVLKDMNVDRQVSQDQATMEMICCSCGT